MDDEGGACAAARGTGFVVDGPAAAAVRLWGAKPRDSAQAEFEPRKFCANRIPRPRRPKPGTRAPPQKDLPFRPGPG